MRPKTLYLNGVAVGSAATWHEVAAFLTKLLRRVVTAREAQDKGSEGPVFDRGDDAPPHASAIDVSRLFQPLP